MNQSAVGSLEEGLDETLTLHRLGMMPFPKQSFRTTNCIEALNSMTANLTRNVKRWTNSSQRHRWLAAAPRTSSHACEGSRDSDTCLFSGKPSNKTWRSKKLRTPPGVPEQPASPMSFN